MRTYEGSFASNMLIDVSGIPAYITDDPNACKAFVADLVEAIGMQAHGEPKVEHFGDGKLSGWTVAQLIETSHIVAHFMDSKDCFGGLHLDLSSCGIYRAGFVTEYIKARWLGCVVKARQHMRSLPSDHRRPSQYDTIADCYDKFYSYPICESEDRVVVEALRRTGLTAQGTTVLDLGCGTGQALKLIAQSGIGFSKYRGIDISSEMLDRFTVVDGGHKFTMNGSRYYLDKSPYDDSDIEIELFDGSMVQMFAKLPIAQKPNGQAGLVTALWSMSYLNPGQFFNAMVQANIYSRPKSKLVAVVYGKKCQTSKGYLPPDESMPIKLRPNDAVFHDITRAGWAIDKITPITTTLQERIPAWYGLLGKIRPKNVWNSKFVMIEATKEWELTA